MVSAQFTLKICIATWNREKFFTKTPYFRVHDGSRSPLLVPPESLSAALVMIISKSVSICNRSRDKRVYNGKITTSYGYPVPFFDTLFEGNLLTQRKEIWSQKN